MALTCWLAGWLAALKPLDSTPHGASVVAGPLAVAAAVIALFAAAQALRGWTRLRTVEPSSARRHLLRMALISLIPLGVAANVAFRMPVLLTLAIPALAYAPFILAQAERRPAARVLAVVAFTALAPATHALAAGAFDRVSAILWGSLAAYYLTGAIFIMARLRRSVPALWVARILSVIVAAGALACPSQGLAHWVLALAFAGLAVRAALFRFGAPLDARRVGMIELAHSSVAALLIVVAIWLR